MNKSQLIDVLAERFGSKRAAGEAVEGVLEEITRAVVSGERVSISGFGVFERVERPARYARNPATGERVRVKETAVPRFKPSQSFKDYVSGARQLPAEAMTRGADQGGAVAESPKKAAVSAKKTAIVSTRRTKATTSK
ncbi:HU family DNA-binding protein [Carbonactinospora thermoautotrophica]|uniref:Histone-like DNA binding protein n=1 Tax=Carbonactinospora thermoautotrophica TaxID=1469144 RepID=A0A132MPI2_9ACTN|nr:HU family DNA-binding protein [Carbonactinospora thermoautotrophica]KWW99629.1 Histone-like DNA binding protein [Carbonactinospora thermoautotrophica]MCX9191805.1 HU family DNA-binding protein [Carbonactinospora thermoautotrophica]